MGVYRIREAGWNDLDSINHIYNDAVLNTTSSFDLEPRSSAEAREWFSAHGPAYPIVVADRDGEVLGWASLSPFAPRAAYRYTVEDSVYVAPAERGRGIGLSLLSAAVETARILGYRTVVAKIAERNAASIAIHERLGFLLVGTLTAVGRKFDRWLNVDIMQLLLPEHGRVKTEGVKDHS